MVYTCKLQHVLTTPLRLHDPIQSILNSTLYYPSPLAFGYHLSPTSLLCWWWLTQQLRAQPGVQASPCTTAVCCQNQHGGTGRNTETGSRGLDHFTQKIMYFQRGVSLQGANAHCYGFPSSFTVIYLCICRQECAMRTGYSLQYPQKTPLPPRVPTPQCRGPESRAQYG